MRTPSQVCSQCCTQQVAASTEKFCCSLATPVSSHTTQQQRQDYEFSLPLHLLGNILLKPY